MHMQRVNKNFKSFFYIIKINKNSFSSNQNISDFLQPPISFGEINRKFLEKNWFNFFFVKSNKENEFFCGNRKSTKGKIKYSWGCVIWEKMLLMCVNRVRGFKLQYEHELKFPIRINRQQKLNAWLNLQREIKSNFAILFKFLSEINV